MDKLSYLGVETEAGGFVEAQMNHRVGRAKFSGVLTCLEEERYL